MAQTGNMRMDDSSSVKRGSREDMVSKQIERQTAKIPSMGWLGLAFGAMAASAVFEVFSGRERKDPAAFVGLWVPTFLLFGIYNKLVKLEGSDRFTRDLESGDEGSSETYAH